MLLFAKSKKETIKGRAVEEEEEGSAMALLKDMR
jgi:hypothetical protein